MKVLVRILLHASNGLHRASWWVDNLYLDAYRRWEASAPSRLYRGR